MTHDQIPSFGLLSGLRVVLIGLSVAAPFAAELYAEHGADVVWIENPRSWIPPATPARAEPGSRIDAICAVFP